MIQSKINLICVVFDSTTNSYKIVSTDKENLNYPNLILEPNIDIDLCLDHILNNLIVKESVPHNFKLVDISLSDELTIYYLAMIIYETSLKDSYFLEIPNNINQLPKNAQKIISLL